MSGDGLVYVYVQPLLGDDWTQMCIVDILLFACWLRGSFPQDSGILAGRNFGQILTTQELKWKKEDSHLEIAQGDGGDLPSCGLGEKIEKKKHARALFGGWVVQH